MFRLGCWCRYCVEALAGIEPAYRELQSRSCNHSDTGPLRDESFIDVSSWSA